MVFNIILGRDEKENKIIEKMGKKFDLIEPDYPAPSAVILDKCEKEPKGVSSEENKTREKVNELMEAYSKKGSLEARNKFDKYKL